ncbi:MAG: class I SAM-dependent methyltransferase [Chitinophagaceae bacterium]
MNNPVPIAPSLISSPTKIVDGISIYERKDYNEWFEAEYTNTAEPWEYSKRASELYRHIYTVQLIRRYNAAPKSLLELGCSKGLMTELLIPFNKAIYAADISFTAMKACKKRCDAKAELYHCRMEYLVATTPGLPFAADSFDTVTLCDGLRGWWLPDEQKRIALEDTFRVLKKGGIAILTDYLPELNRGEAKAYEAMVRASPLSIVEISFLYDKPWYKLESLLKKTGLQHKLRSILASIPLAKTLNTIGNLAGLKAARHILIVVRKE